MADRTVAIHLRAEIAGYLNGLRTAQRATSNFAKDTLTSANKNKAALNQVALGMGAIGVAGLAASALVARSFANFDQAMSNVRAATHETAENMKLLSDAAKKAGADTVFSATEAAGGIEALAKAGITTGNILGGALKGSLDLAAAGGLNVADAAEIAATALTQFGLAGKDVPHVADLLAAGAGKAQGEVTDMAAAFKQSGLVAASFGISLEETVGTLSAFASAGLLGSDAGTSFRTMLTRLANPADETKDAMAALNITAYDAKGNFVGMANLAEQLKVRLGGLTQANRDQAMAQIFGNDAIRAANVLFEQGGRGVNEWIGNVNDAGYAAETAAIKLDNLKGDLEAFLGSLETALIGAGEGADGPLRNLVQGATAAVNAFGKLPAPVKNGSVAVIALGSAGLLAAAGLVKVVSMVASTRAAIATLTVTTNGGTSALTKMGKAAGGLTAIGTAATLIYAFADSLNSAAPGVESMTSALLDMQRADINKLFDTSKLSGFEDAFDRVFNKTRNEFKSDRFGSWIGVTSRSLDEAKDAFKSLDEALAGMVAGGHADQATRAIEGLRVQFGLSDDEVAKLRAALPGYQEALKGVGNQAKLATTSQVILTDSTDALKKKAEDAADKLEELWDTYREGNEIALDSRSATRDWEAAIDATTEALKENGRTLDVGTEKGRANQEALDKIAQAGQGVIDAMLASGAPYDTVKKKIDEQRAALEATAVKFGMTKTQAKLYVDEVLKIPPSAVTQAEFNDTQARKDLAAFQALMAANYKAQFLADVGYKADPKTGAVTKMASGGLVSGPGGGRADMVPARLSNGEYVVNAQATSMYKPLLDAINGMSAGMASMGGGGNMNFTGDIHANDLSGILAKAEQQRRLAMRR